MKILTFIRHAKSDWSNPGQKDFDRPLNEVGYRIAPKMGVKLRELNLKPEIIFCSPAMRTKQTAELLVEQLEYDLDSIIFSEEIYEASTRNLSDLISGLDEAKTDIAFIGHNPSFTYICEYLTGQVLDNIPTCGVVRIIFDVQNWNLISKDMGKIDYFVYPEMFNY